MKILALDFDGVLVDSQFEALFTSFHSYMKLYPKTKIFGGKEFSCKNTGKIKKEYPDEIKEYIHLRTFCASADDYFYILRAIDNKDKVNDEGDFLKIKEKYKHELKNFFKVFYETRKHFQENDFDNWCKLTLPYSAILSHFKKIRDFKVIFITNNNSITIIRTLSSFKVSVTKEAIYDNSFGADKNIKLKKAIENERINPNELYFVDDQISSLIKAKKLGVNCFLAAWGYNNPKQKEMAKKENINLLTEKDFISRFE